MPHVKRTRMPVLAGSRMTYCQPDATGGADDHRCLHDAACAVTGGFPSRVRHAQKNVRASSPRMSDTSSLRCRTRQQRQNTIVSVLLGGSLSVLTYFTGKAMKLSGLASSQRLAADKTAISRHGCVSIAVHPDTSLARASPSRRAAMICRPLPSTIRGNICFAAQPMRLFFEIRSPAPSARF